MAEKIGLEAVLSLGSFTAAVRQYNQAVSGMSKNTASAASSISSSFTGLGSGILKVGAIAGGVGLAGIAALTGGLLLLGSTALTEFAKYERMALSIQSLVARELSQGQLVEQQRTVAISLTQKETQELEKLAGKIKDEELARNTLHARIKEQSEALRQLREAHGEDALNVQTATARLAELENQYNKSGAEIQTYKDRQQELTNKTGDYITVIDKVRTGQMSMNEAMAQAGPRAEELLKWIQLLAINSPFDQEGVANAFRTALAYGFTTEEAQRLTEAELDFVAATGQSIDVADGIALALGQMRARGKVSAEELNQLSERGLGVNQVLETMGFGLKDVEKGLVPVDALIEALIKDMEIFEGAGKAQSTTFAGLMASLSDLKSIGLREFFTGTFTAIQPYLASFVGMLTSAALETGSIRELGDAFGTYVAAGLQKVTTFVSNLTGAFSRFGVRGAAVSLMGMLGFSQEDIGTVSNIIRTVTAEITRLQEVFQKFGASGVAFSIGGLLGLDSDMMITIQQTLTTIIDSIGNFATQVQGFLSQMGMAELQGALLAIGGIIATGVFAAILAGIASLITPFTLLTTAVIAFSMAWAGNWGNIQGITQQAITTITELFTQFTTIWTQNWPIIQAVVLTAWEIIKGIYAGFVTALTPVVTQLQTQFTQIGTTLSNLGINWQSVFNALLTATGIVAAGIGAAILGIIGVVAGLATGIASGVTAAITMFQNLATNVTGIITGLTGIVVGFNQTLYSLLTGDWPKMWEGAKILIQGFATFFTSLWQGMITAATGSLNIITGIITGFVTGAIGFFQGMYNQLVGNSIIPDMVNKIVAWFKKIPQMALSALSNLTSTVIKPFQEMAKVVNEEVSEAFDYMIDEVIPLFVEGFEFIIQSIKDLIGYFNSLKETVNSFSLPDILTPGSPPPMAYAMWDIASGANDASEAIKGMSQNMLSGKGAAKDFFGSLQAGGIAKQLQVSNWNDLRDILQGNTQTAMNILGSGGGAGDIMALVQSQSAKWGVAPSFTASIVEANGLIEHLIDGYGEFARIAKLESLGSLVQLAGSFAGIGSSFSDMLEQQMAGGAEAVKTVEAYRVSLNKLIATEGNNQIAVDKKQLAIEKANEALAFGERQMAIYQQELEALMVDEEGNALQIEKKKLQMDKLTESMDAQGKSLVTLKEELAKLTGEMDKNQKAVEEAKKGYQALQAQAFNLFSGSQTDAEKIQSELATIALLQDFLKSGDENLLIPADAVSQAAGITGILYDQVSGQRELNWLLAEQQKREELITKQKEAQQKLSFLQQQLELIKLGRELGGNIFQGITFGLNANVEDLLAATNAITEAMVNQINADLQIASPSKVMARIGGQVMAGMAAGIERGKNMLTDTVRNIPLLDGSIPQPVFSQRGGVSSTNNNVYNYNFPMTVNTAATASGVMQQYEIKRSMYAN